MKSVKIHTHYDNLKITPNASEQEIRVAYRRLSKKYHPDYNQGNEEATRIMQLVNKAYEVLSDPVQRRAHDLWIAQQKAIQPITRTHYFSQYFNYPGYLKKLHSFYPAYFDKIMANRKLQVACIAGILLLILVIFYVLAPTKKIIENNTSSVDTVLNHSIPLESLLNQSKIQLKSGRYVRGYPILLGDGTHALDVQSNYRHGILFIQIYSRHQDSVGALRTIVLPAGASMRLDKLPAGDYFARYYVLPHGQWQQSKVAHLSSPNIYLLSINQGKS